MPRAPRKVISEKRKVGDPIYNRMGKVHKKLDLAWSQLHKATNENLWRGVPEKNKFEADHLRKAIKGMIATIILLQNAVEDLGKGRGGR